MFIRSRILMVIAAGLCLSVAVSGRNRAQTVAAPAIVIDHPGPNTALSGRETLRAHVEPRTTRVLSLDFVVDGKVICHVVQAPFECIFDAGLRPQARTIQLVALLSDKRQLTREVRTIAPETARDRADVRLVRVPVFVSDARGRAVDPLPPEAVEVLEDKVAQPVQTFEQDLPLDVAVAVDISSSMERVFPAVKVALNEFLSSFRDADTARLFAFSDRLNEVPRARSWSAALDDVVPRGATALYDGLMEAINRLNTQPARRALVVFADPEDKGSRASLTTVTERVLDLDAALYLVILGPDRSPKATRDAFDRLSASTGGRTIRATSAQLRRALQDIRTQLSQYYLLTYPSPRAAPDGREHTIEVKIKDRRDVRVQARTRYLDVQ
jgi:VWFA-related protein